MADYRFVLIHQLCGKPAFGLTERPAPGSALSSAVARHLDGKPMETGARVVCESCEVPFSPRTEDIVERPHG